MRKKLGSRQTSLRKKQYIGGIAALLAVILFFRVSAPAIALGASGAAQSFIEGSVEATLPGSSSQEPVSSPFSLRSLFSNLMPGFSLLEDPALTNTKTTDEGGEQAPAPAKSAGEEGDDASSQQEEGDSSAWPEGAKSIEENDLSPSPESTAYLHYEDLYIKSYSQYQLDLASLYQTPASFTLKEDAPQVLIIHTHATESYMQEQRDYCTDADVDRRDDDNQNVVRVGTEIANVLTEKGIRVIHDTTHHDQPYTGAYTRSEETVSAYLEKYPDIKVVLDIHRDAASSSDGGKLAPVAEIDGQKAAQVMILSGTGETGLYHPNWEENLRFGIEIEKKLQSMYPGLSRGMHLSENRYNMHLAPGYLIIEVGMTGNTMDQAIYSGSLLGNALYEVLKDKTE